MPKPDEINFSFGNKEFNIHKKFKINIDKEMGKSHKLFKNVLKETKDDTKGFLSKINEKIIKKQNKLQKEIRENLKIKEKEQKEKEEKEKKKKEK